MAAVSVVALVTVASSPVAARTNGGRELEKPYEGAAEFETQQLTVHAGGCTTIGDEDVGGTACFKPLRGERFVSIAVLDDSEEPVGFRLFQGRRDLGTFCEKTDDALRLKDLRTVTVALKAGECGTTSVPTQGIVRATFSR
jgi:hypothetical protein